MSKKLIPYLFLIIVGLVQCTNTATVIEKPATTITKAVEEKTIQVGAEQLAEYIPLLQNKTVALVVNQTSRLGKGHLVDILLQQGIRIKTIFAPEHGFRGKADAGEKVADGKDGKTGIPLISLYGKNKKPTTQQLDGIDWVIFDIQDVGARFYTYISTMHYVMEACAENKVQFLVLDRPNPNGHYVDGPVLKSSFKSFVGMHSIPIVHGMTIGEYAKMVKGEGWINNSEQCQLRVVPCKNYSHKKSYELPVKPSPNLPNNRSIYLYPSLCLFEGTAISVGRGTDKQFQIYGHPDLSNKPFQFTPVPKDGAKYPKHQDQLCYGYDLSELPMINLEKEHGLNLTYLMDTYEAFEAKESFF